MTDQMTNLVPTKATDIVEVFLNSGHDRPSTSLLFGSMLRLALPVVESYYSDFYHDAMWLQDNIDGETVFFWGLRSTGTSINWTADFLMENERTYMVEVCEPRPTSWSVRFTPVKPLGTSGG